MRTWGRECWSWISALLQLSNTCGKVAALITWPMLSMKPWHGNPDMEARPPHRKSRELQGRMPMMTGGSSHLGASWRLCRGGWEEDCVSTKLSSHPLTLLVRGFAALAGLHDATQYCWQGVGPMRNFPCAEASPASQGGPWASSGGLGWVEVGIQITSQTESAFKVHFPREIKISIKKCKVGIKTATMVFFAQKRTH